MAHGQHRCLIKYYHSQRKYLVFGVYLKNSLAKLEQFSENNHQNLDLNIKCQSLHLS